MALGYRPTPDWLAWWLDELYGGLARGTLRAQQVGTAVAVLAGWQVCPGADWLAALRTCTRPMLGQFSRQQLLQLAAAGIPLGVCVQRPAPASSAAVAVNTAAAPLQDVGGQHQQVLLQGVCGGLGQADASGCTNGTEPQTLAASVVGVPWLAVAAGSTGRTMSKRQQRQQQQQQQQQQQCD